MTQPPVLADSLQIEPSEVGSRTISRDASTGGLLFKDPVYTTGITLSQLSGIQAYSNIFVVSSSTEYTNIQDALDAVPASSSSTNPHLVLVAPGIYTENLLINKDGIVLEGWGYVKILPAVLATPILTIEAAVSTTPKTIVLSNLQFIQNNAGKVAIQVEGVSASTLLNDKLLIKNCSIVASGSGSTALSADTCNNIELNNVSFTASDSLSKISLNQVTSVTISLCKDIPNLESIFDNTDPQASIANPSLVKIDSCTIGALLINHSGADPMVIEKSNTGNITVVGDSVYNIKDSHIGELSINDTSAISLTHCTRDTGSGSGTLQEDRLIGSVEFVAEDTKTITFEVAGPDDSYMVLVGAETAALPFVTNKTNEGFDIEFASPQTTTVNYILHR